MEGLNRLYERTVYQFDSDIVPRFLTGYRDILTYISVAYVGLVVLGPKLMESRDALKLKAALRVWNFALAAFSIAGSYQCVKMMGFLLSTRSFHDTICRFDYHVAYDGAFAFWVFSFMVSKIPEMMDTVFLVLQKKPILFLHWYHHLTVTIFTWNAVQVLLPSGLVFTTMNYLVHSIMYSYYFVCSCNLRRLAAPVAPLITLLQILQMVVGFAICLANAYYTWWHRAGCVDVDQSVLRMGLAMYGTYFALFILFFANRYLKKSSKQRTRLHGEKIE